MESGYPEYRSYLREEKQQLAQIYRTLISEHSVLINPCRFLLDAGCGDGVITASLAPLVKHILAVDINPVMANECKERILSLNIANISVVVGDWFHVGLMSEVDVLLCSHSLYHAPGWDIILRRIFDLCADSGLAIIALSSVDSVAGAILAAFWSRVHHRPLPSTFFIENLAHVLDKLGSNYKVDYISSRVFLSRAKIRQWLYYMFSQPDPNALQVWYDEMESILLKHAEASGDQYVIETKTGVVRFLVNPKNWTNP